MQHNYMALEMFTMLDSARQESIDFFLIKRLFICSCKVPNSKLSVKGSYKISNSPLN